MSRPLLQAENLCKTYAAQGKAEVRALDQVSFHIDPGETLGLVGESGSGKSTAGRVLLRLIEPSAGRVLFEGREVLSLSKRAFRPYRKAMQMIFQDPGGSMNPAYRIGTVLDETLKAHASDLGGPARRDRAAALLNEVGLGVEALGRRPHELSGGQLQRIAIARALGVQPRLIVADEPVSALDLSVQAQVLNLMQDLKDRLGLAYLFIAHDLAVVKRMSQRVAVLYRGQLVETARSEDLYSRPAHPYTRLLLEAAPNAGGAARPRSKTSAIQAVAPLETPVALGLCSFLDRCPLRVAACREVRPPVRDIAPGHAVACHQA